MRKKLETAYFEKKSYCKSVHGEIHFSTIVIDNQMKTFDTKIGIDMYIIVGNLVVARLHFMFKASEGSLENNANTIMLNVKAYKIENQL